MHEVSLLAFMLRCQKIIVFGYIFIPLDLSMEASYSVIVFYPYFSHVGTTAYRIIDKLNKNYF